MFDICKMKTLDDPFTPLSAREGKGVYFYRINGYNEQINSFILKYYEAARTSGVILEGGIRNPTDANLSYYYEQMGQGWSFDKGFFSSSLHKWLPRLHPGGCDTLAEALYGSLTFLKSIGKTDGMLRSAYIKFMCWMYYKFERIAHALGGDNVPKILFEGDMDTYVLLLLSTISSAGCDIIALQYDSGKKYLTLDPQQTRSYELVVNGMGKFPTGTPSRDCAEWYNSSSGVRALPWPPPSSTAPTLGSRARSRRTYWYRLCREGPIRRPSSTASTR